MTIVTSEYIRTFLSVSVLVFPFFLFIIFFLVLFSFSILSILFVICLDRLIVYRIIYEHEVTTSSL